MWKWRKIKPEVVQPVLKHGNCECGHMRAAHVDGVGKCTVDITASVSDFDKNRLPSYGWYVCACQIYIRDAGDNGTGSPEVPCDPEIAELKKEAGLK